MKRREKLLLSTLVVGVLGSLAALGIFGLFSATTQNAGNEISTGTVTLADNDAGSALANVSGVKPGDSITRCIKVTYTGSLPVAVRMYTPATPGPLAQYIDLTVTEGTGASTFPSCTGFTPDATGQIYSGTIEHADQTFNSYANGMPTNPGAQTQWETGNSVVYEFTSTVQLGAPDTAQASSTGSQSIVWEARSE